VSVQNPYGSGAVRLISTEWLDSHLDDKNLMVIDTQPDIHDYVLEHIPGAIYMNQNLFRASRDGMPGAYAPPDAVQAVLRQVGVRADAAVVIYTGTGGVKGWGDGLEQTMVAYSLARFGHQSVYVLDGGLDKWGAEGRRRSQDFPKVPPSRFDAKVQTDYYMEYEEFKKLKDREGVMVLDARPANVYQGQGPWIKPGHIPGAVNLPWANLMDGKNKRLLKPDQEVKAILDSHGVTPQKTIICSCGTGREATNEFLLLKWYLGYPKVKIYEGSFTEWTRFPDNPTVTGPDPR
jgi:thiosulfate/3-mercaptopyruvate sulfurtransferase